MLPILLIHPHFFLHATLEPAEHRVNASKSHLDLQKPYHCDIWHSWFTVTYVWM